MFEFVDMHDAGALLVEDGEGLPNLVLIIFLIVYISDRTEKVMDINRPRMVGVELLFQVIDFLVTCVF